ncbi:MAG TPA: hypothetical protein VIY29_04430 [Ktedonobacteraceae bacterium]
MTVRAVSDEFAADEVTEKKQVSGTALYDWGVIAVSTWLIAGIYADGWAHNHLRLENFFTPWHGVLYSGLLVVTVFFVGTFIRNRLRGYPVRLAMPAGYELSFFGVILFFFAGIGDLVWHTLFGIELNIDGALSPTHIAIVVSTTLIVAGPYRAAWQRKDTTANQTLVALLPMLLSLMYTLAAITVIAQFAHPFVFLWPSKANQDPFTVQALAVVSIVLQTIILMGFVLLTVRRWKLPFGAFTLVYTLNIALLSIMQDTYMMIVVAALAGLIADVLVWQLKPSVERPNSIRIFAFAVPVTIYLLYFLMLTFTAGVHWTIHLWLGSTVVAGITGLLLSYILLPPRIPGETISQ